MAYLKADLVDISLTDHSSFEIQCPDRFDLLETGAMQEAIHQDKRLREKMHFWSLSNA